MSRNSLLETGAKFNIILCDLFFSMNETDFVSYANDSTLYVTGESMEDVINSLVNISIICGETKRKQVRVNVISL